MSARIPLVAVLILAAVSCGVDDPLTAVSNVVAGVAAEGCSLEPAFGTGVVVVHGGEMLVVTSAITVAGSDEVSLRRPSGLAIPAEVVAFDPDRDIAVIRADEMIFGRPMSEPSSGAATTAGAQSSDVGLESFDTTITSLLHVTIEDIYIKDFIERLALEFDGATTAGDPGAPIFGEPGDVLGIVYARSRKRSVGFAVSPTEIRSVLDSVTDSRADTGRCI